MAAMPNNPRRPRLAAIQALSRRMRRDHRILAALVLPLMIFAFVALPSADASSGVDVSASNIVAEVGGASSFTVRLSSAPSETVYVALITASGVVAGLTLGDSSGLPADVDEPGRRVVLRFTSDNWNVAQTATVHALSAGATTVMVVRYDPSNQIVVLAATIAVTIETLTLGGAFVTSLDDAVARAGQGSAVPLQYAALSDVGFSGVQADDVTNPLTAGASVVFVVDDSGSMDGDWPEVRTALTMVSNATAANAKVALIAFGTVPTTLFPLTTQASSVWTTAFAASKWSGDQAYLNGLTPIQSFGGYKGGTEYEPALTAAKTLLDADTAMSKKIVFMTDAQNPRPDIVTAIQAAGIVIDTIYFGNHYAAHKPDLEQMATDTAGTHTIVEKPSTGTVNSDDPAPVAIETILKDSTAANMTTLYLLDVSFSLHQTRATWSAGHYRTFLFAMTALADHLTDTVTTARAGAARFLGKNELTQLVYARVGGTAEMVPLNSILSPYSLPTSFATGGQFAYRDRLRGNTGSTDLDHALSQAYDDIVADTTNTARRVVLITDGITTNKPTAATIAKYNSTTNGVCLTVVAWGSHADRVYLKTLADMVTACNSFLVASEPTP